MQKGTVGGEATLRDASLLTRADSSDYEVGGGGTELPEDRAEAAQETSQHWSYFQERSF